MSDKKDKKRKRHDEGAQKSSWKKVAVDGPSKDLKISLFEDAELWGPILASAPGVSVPSAGTFKPYTKPQTKTTRVCLPGPEVLLHSSFHPKLDCTVQEEHSNGPEGHLKHYVGVYDPVTGNLQLVQARKAVARTTLRSARVRDGDSDKKDTSNNLSARSKLGLAFGTKKSQKAIHALTANAIQASPSKSKSQRLDPVAAAVVSSMAESSASMSTREELQAEIDEGKPRPRPNMEASSPAEVYPLEQLVGGAGVLAGMDVKTWIDKVAAGEDFQTRSRFVARRLQAFVKNGDVKRLKSLRYLLLMIEWFIGLKPGFRGLKKVPKLEDMGPLVESYGSEAVSRVGKRFADGFELNKWHMDNLITHILALAITADNFTIDTHDIREDLRLENKEVSKYFAELGCVVTSPTESERGRLGLKKSEAASHRVARLKLPLTFPKMRVPVTKKRR